MWVSIEPITSRYFRLFSIVSGMPLKNRFWLTGPVGLPAGLVERVVEFVPDPDCRIATGVRR